ncbi:hypothetical protein [Mycolicibacterium sp.]|uniref:hypothetical protein n=1 Tax=Mycolicibacterium sp. TaxID=2320850 RepID=UPI0037CA42CC
MSNVDRIAGVLVEHALVGPLSGVGGKHCRKCPDVDGLDWIRHVTAKIDAELQPVIETVEQLDALPPGSVVLEAMGRYGDFLGITTIPGVFHKFPAPVEGWYVVAGHGARESTSIELPARVLYTPEADHG